MNEKDGSLEELKKRLQSYKEEDIELNEPHFSQQISVREGSKKDVIHHLLNPEKLVYFYTETGKYNDTVYCLHFKISNTRTMRLPVIFDRNNKKSLYILTYILRYRPWQNMVKKERRIHDE